MEIVFFSEVHAVLQRQLALVSVPIYCTKQIATFIPTAHTSDQPVLRVWPSPGTVSSEVFPCKDLAAECNRRGCLWARAFLPITQAAVSWRWFNV